MKTYYKINEISKLYNIGPDSLRYYEKLGLLSPKRDKNGYRMYNLKDLYKLNIIRDLRQLNFSMEQIGSYLSGQSVSNTLNLLQQEKALLRRQRLLLKSQEALLGERIQSLQDAQKISAGVTRVLHLAQRPCVQISETITRDEEMDFLIKKLHRRHEKQIRDLGNQAVGACPDMDAVKAGQGNIYTSVFFILDEHSKNPDFILPAGDYLSCYYRGEYEQNVQRIQELYLWAQQHNYKPLSEPFELYEVDNRDTACPGEFLTQLQMLVRAE